MSVHILIFVLFTAGLFLVASQFKGSKEGAAQEEGKPYVERPLAGLTPPPVRAPAPVQAADLSDIRHSANLRQFLKLETCIDDSNPCGFGDDNPHSLQDEVVRRARVDLQRLSIRVGALNPADRALVREETAPVARWGLEFDDDRVREEALELSRFSLQPEERAIAVTSALREIAAPHVFNRGLQILAEVRRASPIEVENFLIEVMTESEFEIAETAAMNLYLFLNEENAKRFYAIRNQLPVTSSVSVYLRASLREYERLQAGR